MYDELYQVWACAMTNSKLEVEVKRELLFPTQPDRAGLGSGRFNAHPMQSEVRKLISAKYLQEAEQRRMVHKGLGGIPGVGRTLRLLVEKPTLWPKPTPDKVRSTCLNQLGAYAGPPSHLGLCCRCPMLFVQPQPGIALPHPSTLQESTQ